MVSLTSRHGTPLSLAPKVWNRAERQEVAIFLHGYQSPFYIASAVRESHRESWVKAIDTHFLRIATRRTLAQCRIPPISRWNPSPIWTGMGNQLGNQFTQAQDPTLDHFQHQQRTMAVMEIWVLPGLRCTRQDPISQIIDRVSSRHTQTIRRTPTRRHYSQAMIKVNPARIPPIMSPAALTSLPLQLSKPNPSSTTL
jgi:hypothetical protein